MPAPVFFRASAPGSFMVLGEHAVLHGQPALVAAADCRMHVALHPRADRRVTIVSALGELDTSLDELDPKPPFFFVLEALRSEGEALPGGVDLRISSEFSHTVGLGSSAAVTVALLAAIRRWRGETLNARELLLASRRVIRSVQGSGSGADAAASVLGGITCYRAEPLELDSMPVGHPVALVYCGYKTPTPDVIRKVAERSRQQPDGFAGLYAEMGALSTRGFAALRGGRLAEFAACLERGQAYMEKLGVCDERLAEIVAALRLLPSVKAVKISGSGLGDCVLAWGELPEDAELPGEIIPISISNHGVRLEP